jgi:hypothetical protein
MGVWGTNILSDDTASDVRGDYRDLVGNGLAGHEATDKILREYYSQEESEMGVVGLALAATQWNCGRLEERERAKVLEITESGLDLKWWTDEALERKRVAALSKLREQLLSPQPAAKRIPKPFSEHLRLGTRRINRVQTEFLENGLFLGLQISLKIKAAGTRSVKFWTGLGMPFRRGPTGRFVHSNRQRAHQARTGFAWLRFQQRISGATSGQDEWEVGAFGDFQNQDTAS